MSRRFPALSILPLLLFAPALPAQQGDRKGHDNMASIVPEELVPPAPFLPVDEALQTFTLAPGFAIEAVASEPLVEMPVTLDFDPDGRMWICEMVGYMPNIDGKGEDVPQGRIVI
ncbi:MAG: dehydrogenase, partial [Akkermansiaceae bacterium]|nr:dehydrogenase [Akkermansiaceae bacterium]